MPSCVPYFPLPPAKYDGSSFPTSWPELIFLCFVLGFLVVLELLVCFCHPGRCEVISLCGLGLHFSDEWGGWVSFYVLADNLYVFFGKMPFQVLCQFKKLGCFLKLLLSSMSSLYIWDINLLSDILFANISLHLIGCFFLLLIVFNVGKEAFSVICSHFLIVFLSFLWLRIHS